MSIIGQHAPRPVIEPRGPWEMAMLPYFDRLPGRVMLRSQHLAEHYRFPTHVHPWHQFVHTTAGHLVTMVQNSWYLLSPEQAMWMPCGTPHSSGAMQAAEFRSLYVEDHPSLGMPETCMMVRITPLLRELIIELGAVDPEKENPSYVAALESLILSQLPRQPEQSLHLPWPSTPILQHLCEALYADPSDGRDLEAWGRHLGASSRTLTRRFERDLGISFRDWRGRMRLFRAIELLHGGESITSIALQLGYSTPSAFCYMFHRQMGCTPSTWQAG